MLIKINRMACQSNVLGTCFCCRIYLLSERKPIQMSKAINVRAHSPKAIHNNHLIEIEIEIRTDLCACNNIRFGVMWIHWNRMQVLMCMRPYSRTWWCRRCSIAAMKYFQTTKRNETKRKTGENEFQIFLLFRAN